MNKFIDLFPNQTPPFPTCKENSCQNCEIKGNLNCHFKYSQLLKFYLGAFPPILFGGIGIYSYNPTFFLLWILMFIAYFGFIEIRVMCSHCPHYSKTKESITRERTRKNAKKEEIKIGILRCWANYGVPKFWKYHPGPMSFLEKSIFLFGMILVVVFPYIFMVLVKNYTFLILYSISVFFSFWLLFHFLCVQCINFACPFNRIKKEIREKFFLKNPIIEDFWKKQK